MKALAHVIAALFCCAFLADAPAAQARGAVVPFTNYYRPGSIVVATNMRQLFFVIGNGWAIRYPVGVGKAGMAWIGGAYVARKHIRPAWSRNPGRTPTFPGGAPQNPMGAAAIGLDRGNYAIHGTNDPSSIGGFVSHGCIRMYNEDILDLYARTPIGTMVYVTQ